jgi:hypothetical protein
VRRAYPLLIGTLRGSQRLICMPYMNDADRARVEQRFKLREQQKADAPNATADYYAAEQRVRDRTQELRRLRLASEAQKKARQKKARSG